MNELEQGLRESSRSGGRPEITRLLSQDVGDERQRKGVRETILR